MQRRIIVYLVYSLLLGMMGGIYAQDDAPVPSVVITADNVATLHSVDHWNFADGFPEQLKPSVNPDEQTDGLIGPPRFADFESGWFVMNDRAELFAVVTSENDLWVINREGLWVYEIEAPMGEDGFHTPLIDAGFASHSVGLPLIATYSDGQSIQVVLEDGQIYGNPFNPIFIETSLNPVSQWIDCPTESYFDCVAWLELVGTEKSIVVRMPSQSELWEHDMDTPIVLEGLEQLPYTPDGDGRAMIRIGRIEPPIVVTGEYDNLVKRWDLKTGAVTAEAEVTNGPVVFGQVNASATYLAWHNPDSDQLHLLNFETGEDRVVADINGAYMQYLLVSPAADLIFAVHVDDEPVVIAWDVATGQRYDLGEFRACNREPDMARLSTDGTTLVIGCDTGIDIWQVAAED